MNLNLISFLLKLIGILSLGAGIIISQIDDIRHFEEQNREFWRHQKFMDDLIKKERG